MANQSKDSNPNNSRFLNRKPLQRLSIEDKLIVIAEYEAGVKQCELMKKYNLPKTVVSRLVKNKEKTKASLCNKVPLKFKRNEFRPKHPELDDEVYKWFTKILHPTGRCKPLPLTRDIIQKRALKIADDLRLAGFKASDGWFRNWRGRYGIGKSARLHGEAADVNLIAAEAELNEIRDFLEEYDRDLIFNMDESGINN